MQEILQENQKKNSKKTAKKVRKILEEKWKISSVNKEKIHVSTF